MSDLVKLNAWVGEVPLSGPDAPKSNGKLSHLICYLLTVYERFGDTCVTHDLQWGSNALRKMDKQKERIATLESENAQLRAEVESAKDRAAKYQDELNRIVDYIMGYWPAGFCYVNPMQAVTVLAGEMQRTQQRAEKAEADAKAGTMARLNNAIYEEQWNRLTTILGIDKRGVIETIDAVEAALAEAVRTADKLRKNAAHHIEHGDMDGATCLLSECELHYPTGEHDEQH